MNQENKFDPTQSFAQQAGQQPFQPPVPQGGGHPNMGYPAPPVAPEPDKKNWFARHKILTGIGAVVALSIIVSALGGGNETPDKPVASPAQSAGDKDTGTEAAPEKAPEEDAKEPEATEEAPRAIGIGDIAEVGDMAYKVISVETATTVGPAMFETKAKGTFVVVHVEATNNGNESVLMSDSFFTLKNGEKKFDADSSASLWGNTDKDGNNNSFLLENLNPDLTMSGLVIFDVSEAIATSTDNVLTAQTGFWGTETVDILLK